VPGHKNNNYACTFYDYGVKTTIVRTQRVLAKDNDNDHDNDTYT